MTTTRSYGPLKLSTFLTVFFILANSFAGGSHTGGGDPLEQAFKEVTTNIVQWIKSGNAANLKLPRGVTFKQYKDQMFKVTGSYSVSFSSKPKIDGVEKVCINTRKSRHVTIECNRELFSELLTQDRHELYRLIHHEFAGAARLEKNKGSDSDYSISNQISANLRWERVLRLPIEPGIGARRAFDTKFSCITAGGSIDDDVYARFRFNSQGTYLEMKSSYVGEVNFGGDDWVPAVFSQAEIDGLEVTVNGGHRTISFGSHVRSEEDAESELEAGGLISYNAENAVEDYRVLSKNLQNNEIIVMTRSNYDPEVYKHIYPIPLLMKCREGF